MNNKIRKRNWSVYIIYGLIGQIAWTIENMYLNLYIYRTVTYEPNAIAIMVAASAIVATITTITIGALSDKLGKRKIFMTIGYMLWGVSIIGFGFINTTNTAKFFSNGNIIIITVALIVILDCIMTFFGSSANDAAFQAYVTDTTTADNRGRVEGIVGAMPLVAMLIVFGVLDVFTQNEKWITFFLVVGVVVFIAGFLGIFLIKDENIKKKEGSYLKDLVHGFKRKTIKENKMLYMTFIAIALINIAQQVFMPYFIIYFQYYIGITDYIILLGAVLILASVISVVGGMLVDKYGKEKFIVWMIMIYAISNIIFYLLGITLTNNEIFTYVSTLIVGTILIGSFLVATLIFTSHSRDLVLKDSIGVFAGIRLIFLVMIPMIIGPFIGSAIIRNSKNTFYDEFGTLQSVPTPAIFLAAGVLSLLTLIPTYYLLKNNKKGENNEKQV